MRETDLSYAAGIIDGEGCIRFNRQPGGLVLRVHVTNTDPRLTQWLLGQFGGYTWCEKGSYIPNAKPRYVWEVSAKKAAAFLSLILPYLFLKRDRAEIGLAFQATKRLGSRSVPNDVKRQRERFALKLTKLNKKGVA